MKSNDALNAALVTIPPGVLKTLIDMAASHIGDSESSRADGQAEQREDLAAKKAALEIAREALEYPVSPSAVTAAQHLNHEFFKVLTRIDPDKVLRPRSYALLAQIRTVFRACGNDSMDRDTIHSLILHHEREMEDGAVLGVEEGGMLVQWDAQRRETYTSGEDLAEYGVFNLREHDLEVALVSRATFLASLEEHGDSTEARDVAALTLEDQFVGSRLLGWLQQMNAAGILGT